MDIVFSRALRWVVVLAFGIAGARAAEWSVAPELSIAVDHDSNRTLSTDAVGSEGVSMSGDTRLQVATEDLTLLVLPQWQLQRFSDRRFDRSDDGSLTTEVTWAGLLNSFDVSAVIRDQSTLSAELLTTGYFDLNTRRRDEQYSASWSFAYSERWVASVLATYQSQVYHGNATTPLQNNELTNFGVSEKYIWSERLALTATASTEHYLTEESLFDTRSDQLSVGFKATPTERTLISGDFGVNRRTDELSRSNGFVGDFSVSTRSEVGSVSLNAGRSVVPSGFGVFSQMDQALVNATHGLSERLTLGGTLGWYRNQSAFQNFNLEDRTFAQGTVSLSWQADEYWSMSCETEENWSQSRVVAGQTAKGWQVGVSASWRPLKHSLSR
jgi:hypothetical protein